MKIGIIVYSKTGNTFQVAERIVKALSLAGQHVNVERFTAVMENEHSNKPSRLSSVPNSKDYDALILGAPVQAFSLDPAMMMYLQSVGFSAETPTFCFVTQHFKKPWLGGNQAMRQMLSQLRNKGVLARALGIVNWSSDQREAQIAAIAEQSVHALKG